MDLINNSWNPAGEAEFLWRTDIHFNSLDLFIAPDLCLIEMTPVQVEFGQARDQNT